MLVVLTTCNYKLYIYVYNYMHICILQNMQLIPKNTSTITVHKDFQAF